MSLNGSVDRNNHTGHIGTSNGNDNGSGNGVYTPMYSNQRLRVTPNSDHNPETYDDLQLDFDPLLFTSLEKYLPPNMLSLPREIKVQYMRGILRRYVPKGERTRVQKHGEYKQKIIQHYQPLYRQLYAMDATSFFVPSFLNAISENSEKSFRAIMNEPSPGVYTFEMFQPQFCDLLLSEVEHFKRWVYETKLNIMLPNTMNKCGSVLDDFGFETMLDKLVDDFIRPLARVFYTEVGGSTLDSHHGFLVEYGPGRDIALGLHVDDSEVTLNVCLGKQFSGGELYFRGVRCDKHVNAETKPEEIVDCSHAPGRAILHRGRHRHGARATTSGHRINLLIWCRSSVFRELKKYKNDYTSWCEECQREKRERQRQSVAATKMELLKRAGGPTL